ncbi:hypothetical protein GUITHDRAFT_146100 [Guillardia theta CCMP2712]|uniref:Uncharacterized protein n=1 Tax=Guillardia theta (strain CCMP2712) TaxID=905079 RepID=L1IIM0_GUITC|nr:hypothetical protein GUITHDRAFT_146100 [Guillardia theta CCMP2712]EKX35942.1 hypothetical protein GUITHDRAFT_146100 [Guillardia theta CCMP2712]|eukprot:XP_005822922.1 hypothetical protein GUITHDRAFT_146100 [Guillardia theta CCMP2712]
MARSGGSLSGLCYSENFPLDENLFQPCFCFDDRTLFRDLKSSCCDDVMIYGSTRGSSKEFVCFDVIQQPSHTRDVVSEFSAHDAVDGDKSLVTGGLMYSSLYSHHSSPQYFTKFANLSESLDLLQKLQFPSHLPDRRLPQAIHHHPRAEFPPKDSHTHPRKEHKKPPSPDRFASHKEVKLVAPRSLISDDRLLLEVSLRRASLSPSHECTALLMHDDRFLSPWSAGVPDDVCPPNCTCDICERKDAVCSFHRADFKAENETVLMAMVAKEEGGEKEGEQEGPDGEGGEGKEGSIYTGGLSSVSMANFKIDGKPVSMVFETQNISHGETALVVGGASPFPLIKGVDKSSNAIVSRKKAVYFEQNRKGKKIEKEKQFLQGLPDDQRKQMEEERNTAMMDARSQGYQGTGCEGGALYQVFCAENNVIEKKIKKQKKESERKKRRYHEKIYKQLLDKETRKLEARQRLKERRANKGKKKSKTLSKIRKTSSGGTRRARRTGG